ncbi:Replication initiation factor family protein, partial [Neisseria meningitidis]|nr:Replication initiation factor family protein [Neisseria meningitidis]MCL6138255.1 Replication initiation factor family protein [Neisseria meningitidis]MCL6139130.1 Replication initiation factor family protein [Neisseria meningitidis]MDO0893203.1 Replication initiation factor family protein [Neisseria meningitidis]
MTNRGGAKLKTNSKSSERMSEVEYFSHFISDGKGKLLEIPQRRGKQDG